MIIWGEGARRLSAPGLLEAVRNAETHLRENYMGEESRIGYRPFERN